MGLLFYLSYGAVVLTFAFVTLSLASGLLYVSELIEEHSKLAKKIGERGIYAIIALHGVLYLSDSLPFSHVAFSIFCHVVYLRNFSQTWPLISLTSLSFMGSCVLVIADHFLWFFHFARISQDARHNHSFRGAPPPKGMLGFTEIATFFGICVWAAPLFLFLSLSANDNALPTTGAAPNAAPGDAVKYTQNRVSLFRSILPFRSRSPRTEGILAPHPPAPIPPRSPLLQPPYSPSYSTLTPPRSPGPRPRPNELDAQMAATNFKLDTPPTRRSIRGESSLGQRRRENVFGSE